MTLAIPRPEFGPGRIICLHIPFGFHDDLPFLEEQLLQLTEREGKRAAFCRPATTCCQGLEVLVGQTSREWLTDAAGISVGESDRMIADFGVPVADALSANAGTPR